MLVGIVSGHWVCLWVWSITAIQYTYKIPYSMTGIAFVTPCLPQMDEQWVLVVFVSVHRLQRGTCRVLSVAGWVSFPKVTVIQLTSCRKCRWVAWTSVTDQKNWCARVTVNGTMVTKHVLKNTGRHRIVSTFYPSQTCTLWSLKYMTSVL